MVNFRKKLDELHAQKPSVYQEAIYDEMVHGSGNLGIQAVAGSGKTTTIVNGMKLLPVLAKKSFIAFNSDIVKELSKRVPKEARTSTIHGVGWQSLIRFYRKTDLNKNKVVDIAFKHLGEKTKFSYILTIAKVVDLMRLNLVFDDEDILDLMAKHNLIIPLESNFLIDVNRIFYATIDNNKVFDFTDMVFRPAIDDRLYIEPRDFVFIDEAQDLNKAQQMLFKRMLGEGSRFVAVGDNRQAIYGFAGSDTESFGTLMAMPNTKQLPLSMCYRCAKNIVLRAQRYVPQIEFSPDAPDGIDRVGSWEEVGDGDWVVCRNVRPLVIMCMKLIMNGQRAHIKGKDLGKSIIDMLKRTKQDNKKMCYHVIEKMIEKQENMLLTSYKVKDPDKHASVVELKEILLTIKWVGDTCRNVPEIIYKLESIFTDEDTVGIQMMTIHKSKGLEADRVFLLCPELIPSRFATQPWQLEQEWNLMYVAITRARSELVLVEDFVVESLTKNAEQYE